MSLTPQDLRDVADLAERLTENRRFMCDVFGNPHGFRPSPADDGTEDRFRAAVDDTGYFDD